MFNFMIRNELDKFIKEEVVTSTEAEEILGVTQKALESLKTRHKLNPIIDKGRVTLYWKSDILQRKMEVEEKNNIMNNF